MRMNLAGNVKFLVKMSQRMHISVRDCLRILINTKMGKECYDRAYARRWKG